MTSAEEIHGLLEEALSALSRTDRERLANLLRKLRSDSSDLDNLPDETD